MGIFDPSPEKLVIAGIAIAVLGAFLWLFIRSAVRSGVASAGRDQRDRMDEVRRWEESQRNLPR